MSENPKAFQDWIDDLEVHTFTIYESSTELDDVLYLAYYEKLKTLMLEAARASKQTEYKDQALSIEEALNQIEVRRIW